MSSLLDLANLELSSSPLPASSTPSPSTLPSKSSIRTLNQIPTQVFTQSFSDRILIIITQTNKIGSLIQISPPPFLPLPPLSDSKQSLFPSLPPINPSTRLTPLFGVPPNDKMRDLYELYAGQVGAIVAAEGEERLVLLGLGMKLLTGEEDEDWESERKVFGEIMEMVKECKVW